MGSLACLAASKPSARTLLNFSFVLTRGPADKTILIIEHRIEIRSISKGSQFEIDCKGLDGPTRIARVVSNL